MKKLRVYVDTSVIGEAIPGFDCVKMKREIQAQIYEETKNMTPEEQRERLRQAGERAAVRRKEKQRIDGVFSATD